VYSGSMKKKKLEKIKNGRDRTAHYYSWVAYFMAGMGAGVLITNSYVNPHPIRWGVVLIGIAVLIYFAEPSQD